MNVISNKNCIHDWLATDQIDLIDLVVTDFRMPGLDGFQLAERLQATRPGLPVLFAAGVEADDPLASHAKSALIRKPFELAQLLYRIRELLRSSTAASNGN